MNEVVKKDSESCNIKWEKNGDDWRILLEGSCTKVLNEIEELPPRRKNYLLRRTVKEG